MGNPFAPHRNSATPRVDFQGAAVFVFQKAADLDQTPATSIPTFPTRFPLVPKTELFAKIFRAHSLGVLIWPLFIFWCLLLIFFLAQPSVVFAEFKPAESTHANVSKCLTLSFPKIIFESDASENIEIKRVAKIAASFRLTKFYQE